MTVAPMLGRATTRNGSCCGAPPGIDCADYSRSKHQQRRAEERAWLRDEEPDMIRISQDLNADALYVRVSDVAVDRTVQIDDATLVDLDAAGGVVGIEALGPLRAWTFAEILGRFEFVPDDAAFIRALIKPKSGGASASVTVAIGRKGA